jgi:hypothetical protein
MQRQELACASKYFALIGPRPTCATIWRMPEPLLTTRELNRAVLARQHLLDRALLPVEAAVEAVGALQAQYPPAPPVALWSRLRDLTPDDYPRAMEERRLVTALLMRGTLHVVSGREYWPIATAVHSVRRRAAPPGAGGPIDVNGLLARLAARCREGPLAQAEVAGTTGDWLAGHGHDPEDPEVARLGRLAWRLLRASSPLLNVQSRGAWGQRAPDAVVGAHAVLPPPPALAEGQALAALVRHHLRAFGPAAADDVTSWIGEVRVTDVRAALDALGPEIVRFRDDAGRLLYDLADAPRPGTDAIAPVRYLPWFDSMLLAYAPRFRGRVLPEPYRPAVIRTSNLQVLATFLVDGMVAGTWEISSGRQPATIVVRPFGHLAAEQRRALLDEGERLVRFCRPQARSHAVRVADR